MLSRSTASGTSPRPTVALSVLAFKKDPTVTNLIYICIYIYIYILCIIVYMYIYIERDTERDS